MITELLVNSVMQSKSTFVHVDAADTEEFSELKNIYIYAFSEEESEDKLLKTVDELRKNYVLAHGVVFPQWMKSEVDEILTNGQKYMLKDFRCTFIPPEELKDPTNIGQAFDKNKWMDYFREIRGLSDDTWKEYKHLYYIPVEDIIEAKLPGIKSKYKKQMLRDVEQIINEARDMDEIDFELQKEMLCSKLQNALNVDFLIGAEKREKNERRFIAAMFLLFPRSIEIYDNIINGDHTQ